MGSFEPDVLFLVRQRSCNNAAPFASCISKAAAHLQRLRDRLLQYADGLYVKSPVIIETSDEGKKVSAGGFLSLESFSMASCSSTRMYHSRLEVCGISTGTDDDRRVTEEKLVEERHRCKELKDKVGKLQQKRLQDLPESVQQEHEACAMDIAELQWHLSYQGRVQSRRQSAAKVAANQNQKMKEDVYFLREQCPQLERKVIREEEAVGNIKHELNETLDCLNQAQKLLLETEDKKAEAYGRANQERMHIERNLNRVRSNLKDITEELQDVLSKKSSNAHEINDAHMKLIQDKGTCKTFDEWCENCLQATSAAKERINDLKVVLSQLADEQAQLVAKNDGLVSKMETERETLNGEQAEYEGRVQEVKTKLKKTKAKNEQLNDEIHMMKQDIVTCHGNAIRDRKTSKRCERDLQTLEEQLKVSVEEYQVAETNHSQKLADMCQLEFTVQETENALQVTLDTLRHQFKEESHAKTLLRVRIKADSSEATEFKVSSTKRLEITSEKARTFEKQNTTLSTEIGKLMAVAMDKQQTVDKLTTELSDIQQKHNETTQQLGKRKDELVPVEMELKEEVNRYRKESDEVDWKTDMIQRKLEDLAASTKVVERLETEVSGVLETLQYELDDKNAIIQAARQEEIDLQEELKEIQDYYHDVIKRHQKYVTERKNLTLCLKGRMEKTIHENELLAAEYKRQQIYHMKTKAKVMDSLERKLALERSLQDHKSLLSLQERMQSILDEYHQIRSICNENCYFECGAKSSQNVRRLESVEKRFAQALESIRRFLRRERMFALSSGQQICQFAPPLSSSSLLVQDDFESETHRSSRSHREEATKSATMGNSATTSSAITYTLVPNYVG
ncbi:coiled-coil domain-containing protein 178-like isoform X2 [Corticium candelabrum]|uniref:coiled-coil domain-containing protein 178-like isoform X2 n=1 Tax=Corticium candelabrum TaxID=121492 RepID=UPI002E262ADC|nr:coiled-coil domain-containing protein 178-like isoform X2 [Corticium candelabrum]